MAEISNALLLRQRRLSQHNNLQLASPHQSHGLEACAWGRARVTINRKSQTAKFGLYIQIARRKLLRLYFAV